MANIKLNRNSHVDYVASMYFKACGVENCEFTPKVVEMSNGAKVVLVNIKGTNVQNGLRVDVDLWPRRNATEKDLAALPKKFDDIVFRIGYHTEKDIVTGEEFTVEGQPKLFSYYLNGREIQFSGDVKKFEDDWTNGEPAEEEA